MAGATDLQASRFVIRDVMEEEYGEWSNFGTTVGTEWWLQWHSLKCTRHIVTYWYVLLHRHKHKLCGRPPQYAPPLQVDLWPFGLESGVRVTCDLAYICANFSLLYQRWAVFKIQVFKIVFKILKYFSILYFKYWSVGILYFGILNTFFRYKVFVKYCCKILDFKILLRTLGTQKMTIFFYSVPVVRMLLNQTLIQ